MFMCRRLDQLLSTSPSQCFDESVKLLRHSTEILKMLSKILMAGMQISETWPDIRQTTLHVPETSYKKD